MVVIKAAEQKLFVKPYKNIYVLYFLIETFYIKFGELYVLIK